MSSSGLSAVEKEAKPSLVVTGAEMSRLRPQLDGSISLNVPGPTVRFNPDDDQAHVNKRKREVRMRSKPFSRA